MTKLLGAFGVLAIFVCLRILPQHRAPAQAGTAVRMEIDDLVNGADLVLEGHVLSQRVEETPSGRIDTLSTISIHKTYWGTAQPVRIVRTPGGVLADGRGMIVPGMARLKAGEDVLLALTEPSVDGMRMPVGLAQGKFDIKTNSQGRRIMVRTQGDLSLMNPASGMVQDAEGYLIMDYATVVAELERAIAERRVLSGQRKDD
jgi:hypothetical protein